MEYGIYRITRPETALRQYDVTTVQMHEIKNGRFPQDYVKARTAAAAPYWGNFFTNL